MFFLSVSKSIYHNGFYCKRRSLNPYKPHFQEDERRITYIVAFAESEERSAFSVEIRAFLAAHV